jgi:hypothetical protein
MNIVAQVPNRNVRENHPVKPGTKEHFIGIPRQSELYKKTFEINWFTYACFGWIKLPFGEPLARAETGEAPTPISKASSFSLCRFLFALPFCHYTQRTFCSENSGGGLSPSVRGNRLPPSPVGGRYSLT